MALEGRWCFSQRTTTKLVLRWPERLGIGGDQRGRKGKVSIWRKQGRCNAKLAVRKA